ncbi:MAG: sugar ABC transporter substrate-binding protein [Solirubrobacteraceae bacterium]
MARAVKVTRVAFAMAALALLLAACGGSSKGSSKESEAKSSASVSSSSSSTTSAAAPATAKSSPVAEEPESAVKEAEEAGTKAAEKAGAAVKVPSETIGLVNVTAESEAAQRIEAGAVEAIKAMGWKVISIDAEGNPAKSESGMMSLVNQNVAAILDLSNPTAAITQALAAARAKNIPVINFGGEQELTPNIEAEFAVNEVEFTEKLDEYILKHLKSGAKVATFVFPELLSERLRDEKFKSQVGPHVKIVASHTSNFAALVSDTQNAARTILSANPGLEAFWGDTDSQLPAIAQVLKSQGLCGKVQNYNYYDDKANLAAIKEGCATAIVTSPLGADGWAAVDVLATMFANKKPISSLPKNWQALKSAYGVEIVDGSGIQVISKENLPPEGQYVTPKSDYVAFFEAKWKKEFGV